MSTQSTPMMQKVKPSVVISEKPQGYSADAVLSEAQSVLASGSRHLDDHLAHRLECVAKDMSLPTSHRARALALLCRFG